jgi:hypothetical protein
VTRGARKIETPDPDTTRAYVIIAATLLFVLGIGVLAVASGAIDTLNATGVLGDRS